MSLGKPLFPEICKVPRTTGVLKIRNDRLETVHIAYTCVARESLLLSFPPRAHMLTLISVSVRASGGQRGMELKTETLFIYGCYAPETEVECRARAGYLPLALFLPPSGSSAPASPSLCLFYFYTTLRGYCYTDCGTSYLKQRESSIRCARFTSDLLLPTYNPPFMRVPSRMR